MEKEWRETKNSQFGTEAEAAMEVSSASSVMSGEQEMCPSLSREHCAFPSMRFVLSVHYHNAIKDARLLSDQLSPPSQVSFF